MPIKPQKPKFTRDRVMGIVRHFLTAAGGIAIAYGYGDDAAVAELVGTLMTFVGVVWSFLAKPAEPSA
jgi:hypothetical protein